MIFQQKPAYKHLTQNPSCCWPTCIQMVLFRHWIWVEQEQLAYDLWLVIEENNKDFFIFPFRIVPKGDINHWLKLYRFESEEIISVLKDFWFQSRVIYYSDIWDFEKLIIENISKNNDIVINFKWEWIKNNLYTWWHFVLLSSYDSEKKVVTVCDPTSRAKNYWDVGKEELENALSDKWDWRERGIIIIEKL